MIDNGSKSWTVYTPKADDSTNGWQVIATKWTNNGPRDEKTIESGLTFEQAQTLAQRKQAEYDRLREILLKSAKEVNGL